MYDCMKSEFLKINFLLQVKKKGFVHSGVINEN